MTNNLLKLNDVKTDLIVITTHSNTSQNQHIGINIGDSLITPSSEPSRNLGVLFDSTYSLNDHVSKICKIINYSLYTIGKIRKYLDTPTAEKWCKKLQYIPTTALPEQCRPDVVLVPQIRSYPVLKDLHWLPVEQKIEYKVLLLIYTALHGKALAHISQLLSLYTPTRTLQPENKRCRLEGFGRRCFANAAPSLWNPLPTPVKRAPSIDTFKSSMKTSLFNLAYPSIYWLLHCMNILFVTIFSVFYLQALVSTVTSHHVLN